MFVADMHCDTISAIYDRRKQGVMTELSENDLQIDIRRLKQGDYLVQNFAVFVDIGNGEDPYQCCKNQIALFQEEMQKNKSRIRQVRTYEDILNNQRQGVLSALLTVEEGEVCQGEISRLEELYGLGVRMMTFTWNYENSLGAPAAGIMMKGQKKREYRGLTETGIAFLEKMEKLGILPDVSHLSEEGFYDVCRYSKKPFVASHSDAAGLCPHRRNLTDDMIRAIAKRGGVIGVNYYGTFLTSEAENGICYSRVERIADHIFHMINIGGIACVGLGSDFDGMDDYLEISDCSKLGMLEEELIRRGMHESEIEAVFYRNVCNLYREVINPT